MLDAMTRLVLANAIYFKAGWLFPFELDGTSDGPFTLLGGNQVSVPMMHHRAARTPYGEGDGYQAALLPYTGEDVGMLVILPETGRFEEIEAGLTPDFIEQVRAATEIHDLNLSLPRFDFESTLDLQEILPEMGMTDAFGPADFSGITDPSSLFIDAAIHKATIAVDEKGTEAAAVTVIAMAESAMPPAELTLDRPFIFAIIERQSDAILFLGRVLNPAG
jgi:serpin B